jgi:hypothetical protein
MDLPLHSRFTVANTQADDSANKAAFLASANLTKSIALCKLAVRIFSYVSALTVAEVLIDLLSSAKYLS